MINSKIFGFEQFFEDCWHAVRMGEGDLEIRIKTSSGYQFVEASSMLYEHETKSDDLKDKYRGRTYKRLMEILC